MNRTQGLILAVALAAIAVAFLYLLAPQHGGGCETRLPQPLSWLSQKPMRINVSVLDPSGNPVPVCGRAPKAYTCDAGGLLPRVEWTPVEGAKSYILVVYDPDAPMGTFYHLIAYNIASTSVPPLSRTLPNSGGSRGWYPICPPPGHGTHRYVFLVIALSKQLDGVGDWGELLAEAYRYAIAWGATVIVYSK